MLGGWMMQKMPIGISDFKQLREKQYYFVDKTDFIRQLIDNHSAVTLITRPRRFGKTLTMSMLKYFFSIQQQDTGKDLFAGLAIERAGNRYQQERGKYPVIFLSLKDFSMDSWPEMLDGWRDFLANLFLEHTIVRDSARVQPELIERFQRIAEGKADTYNPRSVVNFFRYHELADYWVNTSGNTILQALMRYGNRDRDTALLSLLHGETVTAVVREGVIYEDIEQDNDTLFTMLLTTGYLTTVSKRRGISGLLCELAIPNKEVRDAYRAEVIDRVKSGLSVSWNSR